MTNPTRAGKIVFDELKKLKKPQGLSTMGIMARTGLSNSSVANARHNIRTTLGPIYGEPLVYFIKNGVYYFRLSDDAREIKDYNAVRLAGIITAIRTQADVAEAGHTKTGDADLYASASSLRMLATNVEMVQKQLLGVP